MFLKTTSGNGSIGEVELAVRIKLRISVIYAYNVHLDYIKLTFILYIYTVI